MHQALTFEVPVLCYHSWRIEGRSYELNDHVALRQDLLALKDAGYRVLPVTSLVSALRDGSANRRFGSEKLICLTFDDGFLYDVEDFLDPDYGLMPSFQTLICDENTRPERFCNGPLAVSFVIASPEARHELRFNRDPQGYWNLRDDWWAASARSDAIAIGNHSWDHAHGDLKVVKQRNGVKGNFYGIDSAEDARVQILEAQNYIDSLTQGRALKLFCYPYGHVPEYLQEDFMPTEGSAAGLEAAFGTGGDLVRSDSNLWNLPRLVCGEHWREHGALLPLIESLKRQA